MRECDRTKGVARSRRGELVLPWATAGGRRLRDRWQQGSLRLSSKQLAVCRAVYIDSYQVGWRVVILLDGATYGTGTVFTFDTIEFFVDDRRTQVGRPDGDYPCRRGDDANWRSDGPDHGSDRGRDDPDRRTEDADRRSENTDGRTVHPDRRYGYPGWRRGVSRQRNNALVGDVWHWGAIGGGGSGECIELSRVW